MVQSTDFQFEHWGNPSHAWNNKVYINEKQKYAVGEILTAYLNIEYLIDAEIMKPKLEYFKSKLILTDDMSYDAFEDYNKKVHTASGMI